MSDNEEKKEQDTLINNVVAGASGGLIIYMAAYIAEHGPKYDKLHLLNVIGLFLLFCVINFFGIHLFFWIVNGLSCIKSKLIKVYSISKK